MAPSATWSRPFLTAYICHCHLCQKRTGSAFSFSVVLPANGLQLVTGQPLRRSAYYPEFSGLSFDVETAKLSQ